MRNKHTTFQWSFPLDLCPLERRAGLRSRPEHRTHYIKHCKYTFWFCGFRLFDWACLKTQPSCSEGTARASHHFPSKLWVSPQVPVPPHFTPTNTLQGFLPHCQTNNKHLRLHTTKKKLTPPSYRQWCSPHIITGFEMQQKAFKT